jgi:RNA polymerase sigma factor (sigma-70 family)
MHKKEHVLAVNFMLETLLVTHFSNRVKPSERKEIQQEIITKILTKNLNYSAVKGSMGQWLYRLIKNHLTDNYRKKKRNIIHTQEDLSYLTIPENEDYRQKEELLVDRWTQYNELLSRETQINQQIMRLRYEQHMNDGQIAEHLGITEGPLAMRRRRLRLKMQQNYRPNRLLEE